MTAVSCINKFLKDDPDPPKSSELMSFLKEISSEERHTMALSIDPDYESK